MAKSLSKTSAPVWYALAVSNSLSVLLFIYRAVETKDLWFGFLIWNLFLAWVPFVVAWWLIRRLKGTYWLTWQNVVLTVLWVGFLPNSFYIVSDFIHIGTTGGSLHDLVMDVAMILSFTFNAYVAGFMSLYLVHKAMLGRLIRVWAHSLISLLLLASGFAIYLGRTLRWNTWDIIINPAGLLFDVSDRFINISDYPDMVATTLVFFLVVGSMYMVIWQFLRWLQNTPPQDLV